MDSKASMPPGKTPQRGGDQVVTVAVQSQMNVEMMPTPPSHVLAYLRMYMNKVHDTDDDTSV